MTNGGAVAMSTSLLQRYGVKPEHDAETPGYNDSRTNGTAALTGKDRTQC
jgi:hypothetical protein